MCRMLARCIGTVVATDAVVGDIHVIEVGWNPGNGRVAVVAVVTASDVRRILAGRRVTVMAGEASSEHLRMVHRVGRCERHIVMTVLAHVARINMRRIFAGGLDAVMTVDTVCSNAAVVEIRGRPGNRCMAIVAVVSAQNV